MYDKHLLLLYIESIHVIYLIYDTRYIHYAYQ